MLQHLPCVGCVMELLLLGLCVLGRMVRSRHRHVQQRRLQPLFELGQQEGAAWGRRGESLEAAASRGRAGARLTRNG